MYFLKNVFVSKTFRIQSFVVNFSALETFQMYLSLNSPQSPSNCAKVAQTCMRQTCSFSSEFPLKPGAATLLLQQLPHTATRTIIVPHRTTRPTIRRVASYWQHCCRNIIGRVGCAQLVRQRRVGSAGRTVFK